MFLGRCICLVILLLISLGTLGAPYINSKKKTNRHSTLSFLFILRVIHLRCISLILCIYILFCLSVRRSTLLPISSYRSACLCARINIQYYSLHQMYIWMWMNVFTAEEMYLTGFNNICMYFWRWCSRNRSNNFSCSVKTFILSDTFVNCFFFCLYTTFPTS